MSRLPDPSWKSGPTEPTPSASEHTIEPRYEEPAGMDIDGVGRDEAKRIDGEPLLAVRELFTCRRDGCDATYRRVHLYRLEDVDMAEVTDAYGVELPTGVSEPAAFLASRATVIDGDGEQLYIGFETSGEPADYVAPFETIVTDDASGPCYGHVEPDPEPYGL